VKEYECEITNSKKPKSHLDGIACGENFFRVPREAPSAQELPGHRREKKSSHKFNGRIFPGNFFPAVAALTGENNKTQERYIVIPANRLFALRAMGALKDNIFGNFETIVHNSQETADDETDDKKN